ncbi:CRISPR-associated helicase Cas3' [Blastopirellula sp. J2-11]|uniref:CRISPR-associated helicase Cas3' n=1 Tax=Blastopirellula sp. J2-11 TaxID=2943192 RepID=UPI0021C5C620|nr:CRISPR-associated helicase Cas3' [Blastopirellula sp. J2-11]UUO04505.1 CRISPR-associated helicase Cas3' [Blastopirellula sp. J2-11]
MTRKRIFISRSRTMYYAHTQGNGPEDWEPLEEHLRLVALGDDQFPGAAGFAKKFGAADFGELLGWWHDLGKFAPQFQGYLRQQNGLDSHLENLPGRVDHSTAGAAFAVQRFADTHPAVARILAYCIAGHHAGLADWDTDSDACLQQRLNAKKPETIAALKEACGEFLHLPLPPLPSLTPGTDNAERSFQLAFFTRMLFSCLVDADYLATEKFMAPETAGQRREQQPLLAELNAALDRCLADKRSQSEPTPVNAIRGDILSECQNAAPLRPGFFSLTVPTGGGKTLSSLSFALRHALQHDLDRIIYAIPFTSIVEQNADVFRAALGDLATTGLVEHHSNFDPKKETPWNRLSAETWNAPLVVTTNIQLLESLFASRTSRCRKLHNIARSVIILDESQTLSVELLHPCLSALRELVRNYQCSVVLCTATQPALMARDDFKIGIPANEIEEIISKPAALYQSLKRVQVQYVGDLSDDDLIDQLASEQQVLCIVNTTRHAAELYQRLKQRGQAVHLSARMCPEHRSKTIKDIKQSLDDKKPCRVISTQVIEAGVDIDFPAVYRAIAGFDSLAQAAGRCNREGRHAAGKVVVFATEHPLPHGHLRQTAETAQELIPLYDDFLSLDAIEHYFRKHYWQHQGGWDRPGVLSSFRSDSGSFAPLADFRSAEQKFQLIPDETKPVIVPWGKTGRRLERQLRKSPFVSREIRQQLQRYTVQIRQFYWDRFVQNHWVELVYEQYPVLVDSLRYDDNLGIGLDDQILLDPAQSVV